MQLVSFRVFKALANSSTYLILCTCHHTQNFLKMYPILHTVCNIQVYHNLFPFCCVGWLIPLLKISRSVLYCYSRTCCPLLLISWLPQTLRHTRNLFACWKDIPVWVSLLPENRVDRKNVQFFSLITKLVPSVIYCSGFVADLARII